MSVGRVFVLDSKISWSPSLARRALRVIALTSFVTESFHIPSIDYHLLSNPISVLSASIMQ